MKPILIPGIAGLVGSLAMSALMLLPLRFQHFRVDVIRPMGAYITRNREQAFLPGLMIHLLMGVLFGYLYTWTFRFMGIPLNWITGAFAGVIHGVIFMLLVSILVLEHHPIELYQKRGVSTGIAQVFGHVVYGFCVGLISGIFNPMHPWWNH